MTCPRKHSELLASSRLFSGLAPSALNAIENAMQEVQFVSGELIFGRGDPGYSLFFIIIPLDFQILDHLKISATTGEVKRET